LAPPDCAVGLGAFEENCVGSGDLSEGGERRTVEMGRLTNLASSIGTSNTYSIKDPRSQRERYIRAAPMHLHEPS